jgi:two-component system, LuxR family, response regulator FixJ
LAIETKYAVIVVEDDVSVLNSLRRLLAGAGFKVQAFDRPSACLAADLPRSNGCFLIDIHLPEINGVELCQALANTGRLLPVILMTGHIDPATEVIARSGNPVAVLTKPFSRAVLMDAIRKALQSAKPAREV